MRVVHATLMAALALTAVLSGCYSSHGRQRGEDGGSGGEVDPGQGGTQGSVGGGAGRGGSVDTGGQGGSHAGTGPDRGGTGGVVGGGEEAHPGPCTVEMDSSADGVVDWRWTYTYDDSGNELTEVWYNAANDNELGRWTSAYDIDGNLLIVERISIDGTPVQRKTYTYDASGNRLTEESDGDGDGTVDARRSYSYDANGNRITEAVDGDGDSAVDARCTFTYDRSGNRLSADWDYDFNGTVDLRCTYTHDIDGNTLTDDCRYVASFEVVESSLVYSLDAVGEGRSDFFAAMPIGRRIYTYDANGNKLSEEWDYDFGGTIFVRRTFTYDASGNMLFEERGYFLPTGTVYEYTTFIYDCWE